MAASYIMFYYVKVAFLHDFPPFLEKKDVLPSGRHASEKTAGHTEVWNGQSYQCWIDGWGFKHYNMGH